MKKILVLWTLLLPLWSLALDPVFDASNGLAFLNKDTINYGVNEIGLVVIVTKENNVSPIGGITDFIIKYSRGNTGKLISISSKKINIKQVSFFYYSYDVVFVGLVSNKSGETRLATKIPADYKNVIGFSWNIALLYISLFVFIIMLLMQWGVPIYFSWIASLAIAISIIDMYLIDNNIFAIWIFILYVFSIIFAIVARYESKRKYEIFYLILSAVFVLVPISILLYMVYLPII